MLKLQHQSSLTSFDLLGMRQLMVAFDTVSVAG